MTTLGVRAPHPHPRLVGRAPVDYAQELQDYLAELGSLASVTNTVIQTLPATFLTVSAGRQITSNVLEGQVFGR